MQGSKKTEDVMTRTAISARRVKKPMLEQNKVHYSGADGTQKKKRTERTGRL